MKQLLATVKIEAKAPISFSRPIQSPRNTGETADAYEERTWRERLHCDEDGEVFIPPQALKICLTECAKYLSESVPGKGKATYSKHFEAGIMVIEPIMLGVKRDDVKGERVYVNADGKKGSGTRVWRTFPTIPKWSGTAQIWILDPVIQKATAVSDKGMHKVHEYLEHAGTFIGLGRFRPRNGGFYGRFGVKSFDVAEA